MLTTHLMHQQYKNKIEGTKDVEKMKKKMESPYSSGKG